MTAPSVSKYYYDIDEQTPLSTTPLVVTCEPFDPSLLPAGYGGQSLLGFESCAIEDVARKPKTLEGVLSGYATKSYTVNDGEIDSLNLSIDEISIDSLYDDYFVSLMLQDSNVAGNQIKWYWWSDSYINNTSSPYEQFLLSNFEEGKPYLDTTQLPDSVTLDLGDFGYFSWILQGGFANGEAISDDNFKLKYLMTIYSDSAPVDDYSADRLTLGLLMPGTSIAGEIESENDRDWFKASLKSGFEYVFDLEALSTSKGTLDNPNIYGVYNEYGNLIEGTTDQDGGVGNDSRIVFTAERTGDYFISAGSQGSGLGTYMISLNAGKPLDDYPDNKSTSGKIWNKNDNSATRYYSTTGRIDYEGDEDWLMVEKLKKGVTYEFDVSPDASMDNPASSVYIDAVYNHKGKLVHKPAEMSSSLTYSPSKSKKHYISVVGDYGDYKLSANPEMLLTINARDLGNWFAAYLNIPAIHGFLFLEVDDRSWFQNRYGIKPIKSSVDDINQNDASSYRDLQTARGIILEGQGSFNVSLRDQPESASLVGVINYEPSVKIHKKPKRKLLGLFKYDWSVQSIPLYPSELSSPSNSVQLVDDLLTNFANYNLNNNDYSVAYCLDPEYRCELGGNCNTWAKSMAKSIGFDSWLVDQKFNSFSGWSLSSRDLPLELFQNGGADIFAA